MPPERRTVRDIEELKKTPHLCVTGRVTECGMGKYHVYEGWVQFPDFKGSVIFGYDEGGLMEHVSVSSYNKRKLPTWDVMARLKDMFFYPKEMVVQIHPAEDRYLHGVGNLENVLHLWRPKDGDFSILNHPEKWD